MSGHYRWDEVKEQMLRKMTPEGRREYEKGAAEARETVDHLRWECEVADWLEVAIECVRHRVDPLSLEWWLSVRPEVINEMYAQWPGVVELKRWSEPGA